MNLTQIQSHLKQQTKYSRTYLKICTNAQNNNRFKLKKLEENYVYYENHHILPKSLFPEFKDLKENHWNGVLLTPKEHFICHFLIMKHYKLLNYKHGIIKMSYALRILQNGNKYNSKIYENIKLNLSRSKESNEKTSISLKGRKRPQKVKEAISKGQQTMSDEAKKQKGLKCSLAKLGKKQSPAHLEANRNCKKASGAEHGSAKTIQIFNKENVIMFECNGNFKKVCVENDLPFSALKSSYQNKGTSISSKKFIEFTNWYALIKKD